MAARAIKTLFLSACLVGVACGPTAKPGDQPPPPVLGGLSAEPKRLAFVCVSPGCDTTQKVQISVVGSRRVAIKRVLLSGEGKGDFTITPSQAAPFILGADSAFTVDVRYLPAGAPPPGTVSLLVTYTDASPVESPDRLEPGELAVPLVRRLVGEPVLTARPERLSFGAVSAGGEKTLDVRLTNEGFGNVALDIASVDAGHPDLRVPAPATSTLLPDSGVDLPVTFAPSGEGYLKSEVVVTSSVATLLPVVIAVEGTSLSSARIALEPETELDFGEVPRAQTRTLTPKLLNQGGVALDIQSVAVTDPSGSVQVKLGDGKASVVLAPLERVPLEVSLDALVAGELTAQLSVTSDDPAQPVLVLPVRAMITEPKLTLTPTEVSFDTVAKGWVVSKPLELRNTGYGALTIKSISMVPGTSSLFAFRSPPSLPAVLERDQRMAIDIDFRAETVATFAGSISVESDDPEQRFREVQLSAVVGTCETACQIANGVPDCSSQSCQIGSCNSGWYDTDGSGVTGCECKDDPDPGKFCADTQVPGAPGNIGTLKDKDKAQRSYTGIVPLAGDEDLIRFYADDASDLFSESFDVKIRLASNDPGIQMCVYRHNTTDSGGCYMSNEVCPTNRYYRRDGSLGSGDDAIFVIKVFRTPGSAPTCTQYTLYMSNGV